jgi:hypothetical protein
VHGLGEERDKSPGGGPYLFFDKEDLFQFLQIPEEMCKAALELEGQLIVSGATVHHETPGSIFSPKMSFGIEVVFEQEDTQKSRAGEPGIVRLCPDYWVMTSRISSMSRSVFTLPRYLISISMTHLMRHMQGIERKSYFSGRKKN